MTQLKHRPRTAPTAADVLIVVEGGNVTAIYAPTPAQIYKLDWDNIKEEPQRYHLEPGESDGRANSRDAREALAEACRYVARHGRTPMSHEVFPSLDQVDWDLLHRQKQTLIELMNQPRLAAPQAEALRGVVHLLDALQDDAAAAGCWSFPGEELPRTNP